MSEEAALKFYYEQLLMGDATDGIPGVPKVGPIKAKKYLEGSVNETTHREIVMQTYYTAYGVERWREELILTGHLIYLRKHHEDKFTLEGWPDVEFEEIEEKPKKGKKKMEPWNIGTALAAVDPGNVIGTKAWEAAMLFLAEESGIEIDDETLGAIETLSNRNGVPQAEIEAYAKLRKAFSKQPIIPLSFNKVVTEQVTETPKYPFPENSPAVKGFALPNTVVDEKHLNKIMPSKLFAEKPASEAVALSIKIEKAIDVCHGKEPTILGKTIPETVATILAPKTENKFKLPEPVPVPTFNPGWGKK
jgi:hypothetical protein